MTCSRCEKEWCWSCGCKVEHEDALDFHFLNPYGCFLKAGFFDGDIPNLLISLLVLILFPIIVYFIITAFTAKILRDKMRFLSYFDTYIDDENDFERVVRCFTIGLLLLPVGLVGLVLCIPAYLYNIVRFVVDLFKILLSMVCCSCY